MSSRGDVRGVEVARRADLPVHVLPRGDSSGAAWSAAIFDRCRMADVDLVVMAGFLHLVEIPSDFTGRVINIHPALLPAFGGKGFHGLHVHRAVLEQVFDRQAELFIANLGDGLQPGGATRALLDVAREWPDGFRLLWQHAAREPQFAAYARSLRDVAVGAAREVVVPRVEAPFAEWASQTLFDHLVDAVLNWLDHGDPAFDDAFVAREAAAMRTTVAAWSAPDRR